MLFFIGFPIRGSLHLEFRLRPIGAQMTEQSKDNAELPIQTGAAFV